MNEMGLYYSVIKGSNEPVQIRSFEMNNELFPNEEIEAITNFYKTYEPNVRLFEIYRKPVTTEVKNLFYGDSITAGWDLQEAFPNHSILNRGIPGDSPTGLHLRLKDDVLAHSPKRCFLLAGINGIGREETRILDQLFYVANEITESGIEVVFSSILPLRRGDQWDRFQYMDKIVRINDALKKYAETRGQLYVDYYTHLLDSNGELAAEYAKPDGTHITPAGYMQMSRVVEPYLLP